MYSTYMTLQEIMVQVQGTTELWAHVQVQYVQGQEATETQEKGARGSRGSRNKSRVIQMFKEQAHIACNESQ